MTLAYIVSYVDRLIMSLLAPDVQLSLSLSDTQVGLLIGFAFAVFYAVMGLPIGWLVDRFNRKWIITSGIAFWSIMTALSGLARGFGGLFAARIGVGVGEAALGPGGLSLIADSFPPEKRARPTGLFTIGGMIGVSAAYVLGAMIIALTKGNGSIVLPVLGELEPWQQTFLIVSAPGLLVALLMVFVVEPTRRGVKREGRDQAASLGEVLAHMRAHWRVFRALYLGYATIHLFIFAFMQWAPTMFLRRFSMPVEEFGPMYGMASLICGLAGTWAAIAFAEFLRKRGHQDDLLRALMICMLIGGPPIIVATLMPSVELTLATMIPSMFCLMGTVALSLTAIQNIVPNRARGLSVAIFFFTTNIVSMSGGPLLVGLITEFILRDPQKIHLSLFIVGAIVWPITVWLYKTGMAGYVEAKRSAEAGA